MLGSGPLFASRPREHSPTEHLEYRRLALALFPLPAGLARGPHPCTGTAAFHRLPLRAVFPVLALAGPPRLLRREAPGLLGQRPFLRLCHVTRPPCSLLGCTVQDKSTSATYFALPMSRRIHKNIRVL